MQLHVQNSPWVDCTVIKIGYCTKLQHIGTYMYLVVVSNR